MVVAVLKSALRLVRARWVLCQTGLARVAGMISLPLRQADFQASASSSSSATSPSPAPHETFKSTFESIHPVDSLPSPYSCLLEHSSATGEARATDETLGAETGIVTNKNASTANTTATAPISVVTGLPLVGEMANEAALRQTLQALAKTRPASPQAEKLLSTAKKQLMALNALIPNPSTPPTILPLARAALEAGALLSIGSEDEDAFPRYYQQLQPFYALPASAYQPAATQGESQRSKITGLYLLLLLTQGNYAAFHTLLESLEAESVEGLKGDGGKPAVATIENDRFIRYPVELEQALMEGAYDRVWKATKGEGVPSEEFGAFSETLIDTIRREIASCSEKAYPSIPVANAKNLLFLDSEGSVVEFAKERRWQVRDGRLYFPKQQNENVRTEREILVTSGTVIENTIGYARELETIV